MKSVLTFPVRVVWQAIVLPTRVLLASLGLTFRAGVSVGKLPVKGGAAVTRALGWKLLGAITLGVIVGFVIGRQFGRMSRDQDHNFNELNEPQNEIETSGAGVAA